MASFNTTLGYTTQNNEWEILTDKELAKHDLLMVLYTRKGECDWDPNFGTTILDKMFRPKTDALKMDIMDELRTVFDNDPRLTLNEIEAEEVDKGWIFYCEVSYLEGVPEQWDLSFTEDGIKLLSTGTYPLGE
jgi:phage baseplate assembly protein W